MAPAGVSSTARGCAGGGSGNTACLRSSSDKNGFAAFDGSAATEKGLGG
jgi:hypothetical protein